MSNKVNLSARWTHPESANIVVGKMGFGQPTWARATDGPSTRTAHTVNAQRPNIDFKKKEQKLFAPEPLMPASAPATIKIQQAAYPVDVKGAAPKQVGDLADASAIGRTMKIQQDYWARLGMPIVDPTALAKPASTGVRQVAVVEYGHKTAGHIVKMTPEQAALNKKKTRRRGYGTCLRFDPKTA